MLTCLCLEEGKQGEQTKWRLSGTCSESQGDCLHVQHNNIILLCRFYTSRPSFWSPVHLSIILPSLLPLCHRQAKQSEPVPPTLLFNLFSVRGKPDFSSAAVHTLARKRDLA